MSEKKPELQFSICMRFTLLTTMTKMDLFGAKIV